MKKLKDWVNETKEKKTKPNDQNQKQQQQEKPSKPSDKTPIKLNVKESISYIKEKLGQSSDIITREFLAGENGSYKIAIVYTDGLADKTFVQDFILKTLMIDIRKAELDQSFSSTLDAPDLLERFSISTGDMKRVYDYEATFEHVLSGDTAIFIEGYALCFVVSSRGWEDRGIQEPSSQTVVRGPKDGFTETLRTNTALLRRKIKDENLWFEEMKIGRKTKTDIAIAYLNGVADKKIIDELRHRLKKIDIDGILESGYIEEMIQDETYTPFPTVYNTERPDTIAAGILEGRIAILVDGTPFALLVPALFIQFFQASEDYYQRSDIGTLIRLLRYFSFFLSLLVPSVYIAVTTFHQEMLPTTLLTNLSQQREGAPFPAFVEAIMMEVTFEILREAGIRMPRAVGSAISIVGALVLGQAAVEAGIVSAAMVIVVSLTAISSFVAPNFNMAISTRILRFGFMALAASFGLFGIILGLIMMVVHLCSLRSFGIPYLSPVAPFNLNGQEDTMIRKPHWALSFRPRLISQKNITREQTEAPKPPKNRSKQSEKESKGEG
ncbi:spore germination protein [Bacillus sp. Marseille-P3661]|uniref:spore germination protein n=1 Tax=Bacillus sp. Marseille-P3661 TaxID=1936234 RepID=UPI000C818DA2|nr:spore germination protein [Bacillus sp. Marseille-P3661]